MKGSTGPAWRPATGEIPAQPGVYRFRDGEGRVIYVGKAKNLRSRLVNYFQDPQQLHPRTAQMVGAARSVQWTIVGSEIEALTLEFQWIKEFNPRYNVMFRDDKSYPYLSVSMGEKYPRTAISRDAKRRGTRYFGPYTQVWAIRETIDSLLGTFPVRTCSAGVLRRAEAQGRPCLLGYLDRCSAPCVGKISEMAHRELCEQLCNFMEGDTGPTEDRLRSEMAQAAAVQDYERAAQLRDQLQALQKVQERNTIVLDESIDADVYALVGDELDIGVHAFYVRGGRVRGTRGWVMQRVDDRSDAQLLRDLLEQNYVERLRAREVNAGPAAGALEPASADGKSPSLRSTAASPKARRRTAAPVSVDDVAHTPLTEVPREILVSVMPSGRRFLREWLGEARGASVRLAVPQRGAKSALLETVRQNAEHGLQLYKTRRSGDLTERSQALEEIQQALDLPAAPLRIECYDVSHTAGEHQVASMVVFEDGAPRKDAYRTFNIQVAEGQEAPDDTAAMAQVLSRRFRRLQAASIGQVAGEPVAGGSGSVGSGQDAEINEDYLESGPVDPETGRLRRFAYRPDLVVVDGGLPQVNAARAALDAVGADTLVVGLAKRLEEIWVPGESFPVILKRSSPGLYLLQRLRDESHRFAIRKHRARRSKGQTRSALDRVPGLGPARQQGLLKEFGSLKRIRAASAADLQRVPGVGPRLAQTIVDALRTDELPADAAESVPDKAAERHPAGTHRGK